MDKERFPFLITMVFIIAISISQVHAQAISIANSTFDWNSLTINGAGVDNEDFFIETETFLFNDAVNKRHLQDGGFDIYQEQSSFNVAAVSGYDDFNNIYVASTFSDSISTDTQFASAEALTSIFIPFQADGSEKATVSFFYELISIADVLNTGEFSLASSAISFSLLDEMFNEIEFGLSDDLFAVAEASVDFPDPIFNTFNYTFSDLIEGDSYFLAIDTSAFSTTEAVSEPTTLLLILLGLLFMVHRQVFKFPINLPGISNSFITPRRTS